MSKSLLSGHIRAGARLLKCNLSEEEINQALLVTIRPDFKESLQVTLVQHLSDKGRSTEIKVLCRRPAGGYVAPPLALSRKWVFEMSSIQKTIESISLLPEGEPGLSYPLVWDHTLTLSEGWSCAGDGCAFRQLSVQIVDQLESNLQQLSSAQYQLVRRTSTSWLMSLG